MEELLRTLIETAGSIRDRGGEISDDLFESLADVILFADIELNGAERVAERNSILRFSR